MAASVDGVTDHALRAFSQRIRPCVSVSPREKGIRPYLNMYTMPVAIPSVPSHGAAIMTPLPEAASA
jgi:hypothetical protein